MNNVIPFKSIPTTIKEAEAEVLDYQQKASSAWTHYVWRACDREWLKYKKFRRFEIRARFRLARLREQEKQQKDLESKMREALK